jgi:hypothetical protein
MNDTAGSADSAVSHDADCLSRDTDFCDCQGLVRRVPAKGHYRTSDDTN